MPGPEQNPERGRTFWQKTDIEPDEQATKSGEGQDKVTPLRIAVVLATGTIMYLGSRTKSAARLKETAGDQVSRLQQRALRFVYHLFAQEALPMARLRQLPSELPQDLRQVRRWLSQPDRQASGQSLAGAVEIMPRGTNWSLKEEVPVCFLYHLDEKSKVIKPFPPIGFKAPSDIPIRATFELVSGAEQVTYGVISGKDILAKASYDKEEIEDLRRLQDGYAFIPLYGEVYGVREIEYASGLSAELEIKEWRSNGFFEEDLPPPVYRERITRRRSWQIEGLHRLSNLYKDGWIYALAADKRINLSEVLAVLSGGNERESKLCAIVTEDEYTNQAGNTWLRLPFAGQFRVDARRRMVIYDPETEMAIRELQIGLDYQQQSVMGRLKPPTDLALAKLAMTGAWVIPTFVEESGEEERKGLSRLKKPSAVIHFGYPFAVTNKDKEMIPIEAEIQAVRRLIGQSITFLSSA